MDRDGYGKFGRTDELLRKTRRDNFSGPRRVPTVSSDNQKGGCVLPYIQLQTERTQPRQASALAMIVLVALSRTAFTAVAATSYSHTLRQHAARAVLNAYDGPDEVVTERAYVGPHDADADWATKYEGRTRRMRTGQPRTRGLARQMRTGRPSTRALTRRRDSGRYRVCCGS